MVEKGLVSVLEHALEQSLVVDLQDLLKRFIFDTTLILLSGINPGCLSIQLDRKFFYLDALDDIEEAVFYRHVVPAKWWKLQRWLGIGNEKRLRDGKQCLGRYVAECVSAKCEEHQEKVTNKANEEKVVADLLTLYLDEDDMSGRSKSEKFLQDTVMNLVIAGRGTSVALSWFFWLVSRNPKVEMKIMEELKSMAVPLEKAGYKKLKMFDTKELKGLVYLHGAFLETLRLFPPIPFEHKRPVDPDILPSGHRVDSNTKILPMLYSMGRMVEVWGKDCLEFKPERWISSEGEIKHVPSYKFMAFNSGPRTCIGKEIAFTQMRVVAATLLHNYHFETVEGHTISPKNSTLLHMSNGMKVEIKRRV